MNFPKLKNALFCRILVCISVLGGLFVPMIILPILTFIPEIIRVIALIVFVICFLVYVIKNAAVLIALDLGLATIHCYNKARKHFTLPPSFDEQEAEYKISRIGLGYEPLPILPLPELFRYKSTAPMTVYSSGIEKIVLTYHTEFLDKELYHSIINSAHANSNSMKGKTKHRFLDKAQKEAPLNRAMVVVIFAKRVEEKLRRDLSDMVCKNTGDGFDTSFLPCVVDAEKQICTFDSMCVPYIGFQYAVKNRAVNIIRKYLFDKKFTFDNSSEMLEPIKDLYPEQTLWSFWKNLKKDLVLHDKELKSRFEKMKHEDIIFEDEYIYMKWNDNGIWMDVEIDEELKTAEIDHIDMWDYPKSNKIGKDTVKELEKRICAYFAKLGYTVKFIDGD